jgi:hypothetical protein
LENSYGTRLRTENFRELLDVYALPPPRKFRRAREMVEDTDYMVR